MNIKSIALKSIFIVILLLSCIISLFSVILLFVFIFNPDDKLFLYSLISSLLLSAIFWGTTFYLANLDKNKTKEQKRKEFIDLLHKIPLILASLIITSFYVLIYFFIFGFITVSKYGKGGWGGDAGQILIWMFLFIAIGIFGTVMYRVFKTEKQDITLTLYNQFTILKWSSLIALIFGIWSTYYFYRNQGAGGWAAMFVWDIILYVIYKLFDRLSNKAQDSITDSNLNRIIHEKKKKIMNKNSTSQTKPIENISPIGIADELKRLKELLDQGIITQEEFDIQKQRLIQKM